MGDDSWWDLAACHGVDVETFYSSEEEDIAAALAICEQCVVRTLCLDHAMTHEERFGVWGGTRETERRRVFRKRRRRSDGRRPDAA